MIILETIGMLMHVYQKIVIGRLSFLVRPENLSSEVKRQSQVLVLVEIFGTASKVRLFISIFDKPLFSYNFWRKGRLYEYQYLCKKIPNKDSWFWKYYPSIESTSSA